MTHAAPDPADDTLRPVDATRDRTGFLSELARDLRLALRGIRRSPSFTVVALATIAIGVGATTTAVSIAYGMLYRPADIVEPERTASIWEVRSDATTGPEGRLLPWARYEQYREATPEVFSELAGHRYAHLSVRTDDGAVSVDGFLTSGNYFAMLGVSPGAGRFYMDDDDMAVVLSDRLWRRRFGADPAVVGRTLSIASRSFTVAAVAPAGFVGTMSAFTGDLWIPAPAYGRATGIGSGYVVPIGRLAPGVERAAAEARVDQVARTVAPVRPTATVQGARLERLAWRSDIAEMLGTALGVLAATAALLLLVACANIAGMMLARAWERRREVAVRLAVGAGRARLVRQMLTESVLLFLVGGAGGVLVAAIGTRAVSQVPFPVDATITLDVKPNVAILLFSLALSALTGVVFGVGPALRASGVDLATSLKEGGLGGRHLSRGRGAFVVGQIALATLLLVVAGLFVRSMEAAGDVDPGFEAEGVLVATLNLSSHGYDVVEGRAFQERLAERVRTLPGVEAAGLGRFVPLGGANTSNGIRAVGGEDAPSMSAGVNVVDPAFFDALRIGLVAGRFLEAGDREGAPYVAVVNERLAGRLWPGERPIGKRFRTMGEAWEVVGVAQDGAYAFVYEDPKPFAYFPFAQVYRSSMSLHVRAPGSLPDVAAELRRIVNEMDPNVALEATRTMSEVLASNRLPLRFIAGLTALFGGIGLLLACLGVYGLLAVQVAQRRREFGVRMALGAGTGHVLAVVIRRGVALSSAGAALGLVLAFSAAPVLASVLFGVAPRDPLTFVVVPATLIAVAMTASALPARHASRSDPLEALRAE